MNMNLKLDLDYKKLLPLARKFQSYVFGALLVGVFGYTAYTINVALNVKASVAPTSTAAAAAKVSFDKTTIDAVKNLSVVQGSVPTGDLGKDDPFK